MTTTSQAATTDLGAPPTAAPAPTATRGRRVAGVLLPAAVLVVPVVIGIVLRLRRLVPSSDSVAQQSVVQTWFRAGHGHAYLPPDTWLLKIPLYAVVEALPLAPTTRLLVESAALAVIEVGLLAAGALLIVRSALPAGNGASLIARWDVVLPLAWVGTVGGGLGEYLAAMPNSRNVELGLSLCLVALAGARLRPDPARPRRRVTTAAVIAGSGLGLGLLWVDDPYVEFLVGAPLALGCLAWFLLRRRDPRLLGTAAAIVLSLAAVPALRLLLGLFRIVVVQDETGVTLDPLQILDHLPIMWPALRTQVGVEVPFAGGATGPAQVGVLAVLAVGVVAAAWLAGYGWRTRNLPIAFLGAHWPVVVVGVLLNRTIYDFHAGRYLVLGVVDLAVSLGVATALLRPRRPRLATSLAVLVTLAAVANLAGVVADGRPRPPAGDQQERTLAVLEGTGATKGFSAFWSADLYTQLSGGRILVSDVSCGSGRLRPRYWLTDSARATRPAARTFVLWNPQAPDQRGCSPDDVLAQFGEPATRLPAPTGGSIWVYDRDVTSRVTGP